MCGIAGLIDFADDARRYGDTYKEMLYRLRRRGPDENRSYLTQRACLLHTRLSVVDLENGKQPMREKNGEQETVLVYNGELYNTEQLRRGYLCLGIVLGSIQIPRCYFMLIWNGAKGALSGSTAYLLSLCGMAKHKHYSQRATKWG